jgi:TM2 domain-containing membrane protein YozV
MNCSNCQRQLREQDTFCNFCGQVIRPSTIQLTTPGATSDDSGSVEFKEDIPNDKPAHDEIVTSPSKQESESDDRSKPEPENVDNLKPNEIPTEDRTNQKNHSGAKNLKTVWLIAVFGGWLGLDRFYLGHVRTGIGKLLGGGWYGIWWTIDMIRLLRGRQVDKNGVLVEDPDNFMPVARVISTVLITLICFIWFLAIIGSLAGQSSE